MARNRSVDAKKRIKVCTAVYSRTVSPRWPGASEALALAWSRPRVLAPRQPRAAWRAVLAAGVVAAGVLRGSSCRLACGSRCPGASPRRRGCRCSFCTRSTRSRARRRAACGGRWRSTARRVASSSSRPPSARRALRALRAVQSRTLRRPACTLAAASSSSSSLSARRASLPCCAQAWPAFFFWRKSMAQVLQPGHGPSATGPTVVLRRRCWTPCGAGASASAFRRRRRRR